MASRLWGVQEERTRAIANTSVSWDGKKKTHRESLTNQRINKQKQYISTCVGHPGVLKARSVIWRPSGVW